MLLDLSGVHEFIEKLKSKKTYIDQLSIKYNPRKNKPFSRIWCHGMEDVHQENAYYDNILENIEAAIMIWFEPICVAIKAPLQATVDIDEEGNFKNKAIKVSIDIFRPREVEAIIPFLYIRLKSIVLLNEYVDNVEINGYKGELQKLKFNMTIDGSKIHKILKNGIVNRSILEQWLGSINNNVRLNKNEEQYENMFYVVNGKINVEYKSELVHQYFPLSKTSMK